MKVKHTTYLHIKFSQHIVIVKTRLYRLTRNRMVLPRNRTRSARRLPHSLEQSHNSTGTALNDPTTQGAPHSKRERRLGTRQIISRYKVTYWGPKMTRKSIESSICSKEGCLQSIERLKALPASRQWDLHVTSGDHFEAAKSCTT